MATRKFNYWWLAIAFVAATLLLRVCSRLAKDDSKPVKVVTGGRLEGMLERLDAYEGDTVLVQGVLVCMDSMQWIEPLTGPTISGFYGLNVVGTGTDTLCQTLNGVQVNMVGVVRRADSVGMLYPGGVRPIKVFQQGYNNK